MSYILEALRKADAQRERSRLPGLQAQPHPLGGAEERSASQTAWVAAVVALVLGAGGFAAWHSLGGEAEPVTSDEVRPPAPSVAAVPPPAAPAAEILPPAPPPLPAPAPAPAPVAAKAPAAVGAQAPAKEPGKGAELQGAPSGAPSLAVSGGVWSQNPAQRLLIVDGQVFNEGSEVAPGVRLEEVKQHRAVLSFRGQRYAVPY